jgi:thiol-disulfide isomerase/thioredoxin
MSDRPSRAGAVLTWTAIVGLGAISAGLGWWLGVARQEASGPPVPPGLVVVAPGERVPDLDLVDLRQGHARRLPAPDGRPRLVNYWASWCGPCREEMPVLERFARTQGADGVEVVGIALDAAVDARRFLTEVPVTFPLYLETPGPADSSVVLGNTRGLLPFTALVGADGRLLKTHYGPFPDAEAVADWADAR